jgi:hypothetical protein
MSTLAPITFRFEVTPAKLVEWEASIASTLPQAQDDLPIHWTVSRSCGPYMYDDSDT